MFEQFYRSFWQHPLLLWVVPVGFLLLLGTRERRIALLAPHYYWSLVAFTVLTIVDPLMTGPVVSWLEPSAGVADAIMIFFVILGDFRWFFFFECFSTDEGPRQALRRAAVLRALAWAFVVPVLQAASLRIWPHWFDALQKIFLVYEVAFFVLALLFVTQRLPGASPAVRGWKRDIGLAALAYYGLWATADVLILTIGDAGYALRVVPNQLYYALFLPWVHLSARTRSLV